MKHRVWFSILSAALLSSLAIAQIPSRFDLTANGSLGSAQLVGAPSGSQQRSFGWQTSGISHFNSWLGMASQFSAGYASASSLQLIGYTGNGKIQRYSSLMGPRITFASRSRVNPYIEALGGIDYASTKFTSNGTIVTGRELESAYSIGGGAQIKMTRRVGLNVEAHYFETNHSLALLGWMPSHLQISAGLVFRLSNLRDRRMVVDQQPLPVPSPNETQTTSTESESATTPVPAAPVTTMIVTAPSNSDTFIRPQPVQAPAESHVAQQQAVVAPAPKPATPNVVAPVTAMSLTAAPNSETNTRPQPVVQATVESHVAQQQPVVAPAPKPATPNVVAQFQPSTVVSPTLVAPGLSQMSPSQSQAQSSASAPVAAVAPSRPPVQAQVQAAQTQPVTTPRPVVSSVPPNTYAAAPAQPLSLGEYARKLREKKQQHKQADW